MATAEARSEKDRINVFDGYFNGDILRFKEYLTFVEENKFGAAWTDGRERHEKTMKNANQFVGNLVKKFRDVYEELSKVMEEEANSPCDAFRTYICEKLRETCQNVMLEKTFNEIKRCFDSEILQIEGEFNREVEETDGDLEAISQTKLLDAVHINHALLCCRVAYDCEEIENPEQCLKSYPNKHFLRELVVSCKNQEVPRYTMARCGDVLYVAFRGLENTLYTSAAGLVRPKVTTEGTKTNSIIYEEAQKIPLSYFTREIIQAKRVILTGHSTGGAVATLVTVFLMERLMQFQLPPEFLKRNVKCITFGVTPVGDKNLKEYVESTLGMKECFCHYVKHDDIIPKLFGSNISEIQDKLIKLIMDLVQPAIAVTGVFSPVVLNGIRACWDGIVAAVLLKYPRFELLPSFDIVGVYYILNPSKDGGVTECTDEEAVKKLSIKQQPDISESCTKFLINHRIDKYDSDIRDAVIKEYSPALNSLLSHHETKKPSDIIPIVNGVQFQKYEGKVVAKIIGENMWFVHEVKMHGIEPLPDVDVADVANNAETLLSINISKNTGSSVEVRLDFLELLKYATVNVKVKSHLENSQPDEHGTDVKTCIKSYGTTKRQEELADLEPYEVIELAFLNAILESRNEEDNGERYSTMMFFNDILYVVPIESLFYAIAQSDVPTVVEGCKLLLKNIPVFSNLAQLPSVRQAAQLALKRLKELCQSEMSDANEKKQVTHAKVYVDEFLRSKSKEQKRRHQCLGAVYLDSSFVKRLENWRKELHSLSGKTNDEMLKTLNDIEEEFKVCNRLFNAFINVDTEIPMEPQIGMSTKDLACMCFGLFSGAARGGRLGVLVALGGCAARLVYAGYKYLFPGTHKVSNYVEKLAFLLTSMEKNPVTDKATVPVYYLERRLVEQCGERGLDVFTKVSEVRQLWDTAFKDETLHLVDKNYRGIISSWIIYSLMINSLRENLAKKTTVGVIGLLNSGKSTLVKSLFGIKNDIATGTMVENRTTVPYIYSLEDEVEGLEVIDFPGVNDQDKSISELANLLLRLTRVVVFLVDYRSSRSKATVEWLKILDENKVPVLVCLSFADKLFAENMSGGRYPDQKEVKEKLDKERDRIKEEICQSKQAKQDFEFMVLGFDNDSCLNSNEAKKKLVEAGLEDELEVGRWIAKTFQENKQDELSKRLLDFVAKKESSTLHCSSV